MRCPTKSEEGQGGKEGGRESEGKSGSRALSARNAALRNVRFLVLPICFGTGNHSTRNSFSSFI